MVEIETNESGRRAGWTVAAMAALFVALMAVGVYAVVRFAEAERERDLYAWQVRLGIVADSRVAAVNDWLERHFSATRGLAENASLQLYLSDALDAAAQGQEAPQTGYLRNLLVVTAERAGFAGELTGPDVPANVERLATAGLALTDPDGRIVASTRAMPPLQGPLREALARREPGQTVFVDAYIGAAGQPTVAFISPVFAVQQDPGPASEIGLVIGVRTLDAQFYALLKQPGETLETAENLLVRLRDDRIEYLSPLKDGTRPLERVMAADTPDLASVFARRQPGGFALRRDYAGAEVLVTGRQIAGTPWTLMRKVDAAEALSEIDSRQRTLIGALLGALALAGILLLAVWRHGTSVRASRAAARFQAMAERFERLSSFLRLVTDGQPNAIAAVDRKGRFRFANRQAAEGTGISSDEMIGKRIASVFGPVKAKIFERLNRQALESGRPASETHTFEEESGERVIRSDHIPLSAPFHDGGPDDSGVLMVLQDITDLVGERNRRVQTLRQLVSTLVTVVDRRDPYSAHHSNRVAEVATSIAREMDLDETEIETVGISAQLMNLGKILVPTGLLTKSERLSDEELGQVRDAMMAGADMLEGVAFDGPVVETLRQLHEHWDGSGMPRGLKGEDILVSARVVSVANAFVAMVSPRSYRSAIGFDDACEQLRKDENTYDRRPVSALINIIDNRGGRERWASFRTASGEAGS